MKIEVEVSPNGKVRHNRTLEGDSIRIGRSRSCDLTISRDMISSEHAVIEASGNAATIRDLGSTNGTFVNSERLSGTRELATGDEVVFGNAGPTVRVLAVSITAKKPATPTAYPGPSNESRSPAPSSPTPILSDPHPPPPSQPKTGSAPSRTRAMLASLEERNRRSWSIVTVLGAVAGAAAVLLVLIVAINLSSLWEKNEDISKEVVDTKDEINKKQEDFEDEIDDKIDKVATLDAKAIFEKYGKSVYRVRAGFSGTAFAVGADGIFATNGHVAKPLQERLAKGESAYLVAQGNDHTLKIISARPHPKYRESSTHSTPDVGYLRAEVPSNIRLTTVELASESELRALSQGSPLCYIGFPAYLPGDYKGTKGTIARVHTGLVVRMLDDRDQQGTFATNRFIEHSMWSAGGASGSPVFNRNGRVIGLHYADAYVFQDDGSRQEAPASVKYAARVDFLTEILP